MGVRERGQSDFPGRRLISTLLYLRKSQLRPVQRSSSQSRNLSSGRYSTKFHTSCRIISPREFLMFSNRLRRSSNPLFPWDRRNHVLTGREPSLGRVVPMVLPTVTAVTTVEGLPVTPPQQQHGVAWLAPFGVEEAAGLMLGSTAKAQI